MCDAATSRVVAAGARAEGDARARADRGVAGPPPTRTRRRDGDRGRANDERGCGSRIRETREEEATAATAG